VARDDERQTRPEHRRPSITEAAAARERIRNHPGAEPSSLPPAPEEAPIERRRSWLPREIPGWVGKAAAALFAAIVLPNVPAITRRIDAGTAVVVAEAELKREGIKTEQAKQRTEEAKLATFTELHRVQREQATKLERCEGLEERIANLEGDNALGIFARAKKRR
jgi:hypothetical protein